MMMTRLPQPRSRSLSSHVCLLLITFCALLTSLQRLTMTMQTTALPQPSPSWPRPPRLLVHHSNQLVWHDLMLIRVAAIAAPAAKYETLQQVAKKEATKENVPVSAIAPAQIGARGQTCMQYS